VTLLAEEVQAPSVEAGAAPTVAAPWLLAAVLSLGAGAIHFAFAPTHFDERTSHGAFFLAVGACQVAWAVLALWRPSRRVAWLGLLNLVVVGVWIVSRTAGISGDVEPVGYPDVLTCVFEAGVVLALLVRPRLRTWSAAAAAVVVAGATVWSLTPRYAGAHEHDHVDAAAGAPGGLTGTTPCERSGAPVSPAQVTDTEGHFHRGLAKQQPIDQPMRLALAQQQVVARGVADRFPTVADAMRAGYRMSTAYVPCIGAHYTNIGLVARFDPATPSELLYDGTRPDSKLVGLSYLVYHPGGAPEGFAGPNDIWHQHNSNGGLCFNREGVVIAGEDTTPEQCAQVGGRKRELTDVWMLHDWIVPGWECTWGVFAPECPELGGRTGATAWD
jgi:hypothetical protein